MIDISLECQPDMSLVAKWGLGLFNTATDSEIFLKAFLMNTDSKLFKISLLLSFFLSKILLAWFSVVHLHDGENHLLNT